MLAVVNVLISDAVLPRDSVLTDISGFTPLPASLVFVLILASKISGVFSGEESLCTLDPMQKIIG